MSSLNELVRRFYVYRGLTSEGFVYPILTVHALAQGLDLAGVGFAAGSFFVGTLLGEIPTGYLGDRIGRRNGLALGSVLVSMTHLGFAFAHSLTAFVALWGFWGVAATFRSGTTNAWLYDTLADRGATASFARVHGRSSATFYAAAATTALAGGVLYELWAPLPFLAAATLTGLGALVILTLPEPSASSTSGEFSLADARAALVRVVSYRRVRSFVFLSGVAIAVPETVEVSVQPVALWVGFAPATLGGLYAGLMLAAADGVLDCRRNRRAVRYRRVVHARATASRLWFARRERRSGPRASGLPPLAGNEHRLRHASKYVPERSSRIARSCDDARRRLDAAHALLFFLARTAGGTLANATTPLVALATFGFVAVGSVVVSPLGFRPVRVPRVGRRRLTDFETNYPFFTN